MKQGKRPFHCLRVQQVVEARKKVEAAVREEADSQESELSSATQEPRVEPQ